MAHSKRTLQDVARLAAERNGAKGGRALQRIAESKGLTLSYATVDRILAGKYESTPQRPTIEALAMLSGLPVDEVFEAAGLPLPMAPFAEQVPEAADYLSVDQRRVVLDVIRGFVRDNERMADLERRIADLAGNDQRTDLPSGPQPDGATTSHLKLERPWWQRENVAADQGVRELDAEDAEAGERGEGSQDPDDYR